MKEELEQLYHDMYAAMIRKDITALSEMLAPSFVLIHMTGMHQTKEEFLEAVKNGTLNYFEEKTDHLNIQKEGNHVLVRGQSRVTAAVFGGSQYTWRLEQDLICSKENGKWQIIKSTASSY